MANVSFIRLESPDLLATYPVRDGQLLFVSAANSANGFLYQDLATGRIKIGEVAIGTLPATGVTGVIYWDTADSSPKIWNGTAYVKPVVGSAQVSLGALTLDAWLTNLGSSILTQYAAIANASASGGGVAISWSAVNPATGVATPGTATITLAQMGAATENDVVDLQAQIDTIRGGLLMFAVDFQDEFGTATPTKTQVDTWLAAMQPPVTAAAGTSVKNTNTADATYNHAFVYYTDPEDPDELILIDDGISIVTIATATTLGVVRGGGQVTVDLNGDMAVGTGTVTETQLVAALQTKINGKLDTADLADEINALDDGAIGSDVISTDVDETLTEKLAALDTSISGLGNSKVDKVSTAVVGNFSSFVSGGGIADSGASLTSIRAEIAAAQPVWVDVVDEP